MTGGLDDSQVIDHFEKAMRDFIIGRLSGSGDNWWDARVPPEIRDDASERHRRARKINDVLNKPAYDLVDYINFDGYEKIISRKDNWRDIFEETFLEKSVFEYKMRIVLSLRNDIKHGRAPDPVNSTRLRLHCYDLLSQICESGGAGEDARAALAEKFGLAGRAH